MLVPSMLDMADVMAESGYTEEQVFDLGIAGSIVFLVVVPELGACRVPDAALSHFMAGADEYTAAGMPEHYSGAKTGRWTIKRDRLRILPRSWDRWTDDAMEIARLERLASSESKDDLLKRVLHHLEGEETELQHWQGGPAGSKSVELKTFGPDRWIERVHERGILSALDCIALIHFVLEDYRSGKTHEDSRRIAEGWAAELRKAAEDGEIRARDATTLLALPIVPKGWDWAISMDDANGFVAARGMEWTCQEIAAHLYEECQQGIQRKYFPPWMRDARSTTFSAAPPAADPLTSIYAAQKAHRLAANCYEIYEAAEAIAKQLGLNKDNEEKLRDDMAQAAFDEKLTVRSPRGHDQYAPTKPPDNTYSYNYLTTPDDVNKWASSRGFTWRWEVQLPKPQAKPLAPESACAEPSHEPTHWKMRVQSAAAEHWKTLRASGANPTVSSIVEWMAKWCRENNVRTDGGINPSSGYLRTHVLGGANWIPPT